jgi:hypothetical protein
MTKLDKRMEYHVVSEGHKDFGQYAVVDTYIRYEHERKHWIRIMIKTWDGDPAYIFESTEEITEEEALDEATKFMES